MRWQLIGKLYFKEGDTFAIDANVYHRKLRNGLFAAQVVKDAICDRVRKYTGGRPSVKVQNPDIQINLFIQHQDAVISFDTSGDSLHKRGYRQESVEAPIQENIGSCYLASGTLYEGLYFFRSLLWISYFSY